MKKIAFNRRWLLLGPMLLVTLAATAWVSQDDGATSPRKTDRVKPTVPSLALPPAPVLSDKESDSPALIPIDKLQQRTAMAEAEPKMFAGKSWYVAPPPPKPVPPPRPSAPPLPFSYMGQMQEESGKLMVYLAKGDRAYTVSQGDVIDNLYRVESATTRQLVLIYLPLSIKQTLSTGTGS